MTREKALKALKIGAWTAFMQGAIITFVTLTTPSVQPSGQYAYIDASVFLLCGFGMFKKSRFAAVIAILLLGTNSIIAISDPGARFSPLISLVLLIIYFLAIRGAYTLNAIRKAEDPTYKGTRRWVVALGMVAAVIVIFSLVVSTLSELRIIPSGEVEDGATLDPEIRAAFVEYGIIYADEQVEQYYFLGFFSELTEGALLTNRAVVYYYQLYDELFEVVDFPFEQIIHVEMVEEGSAFADSVYMFESISMGMLFFPLSNFEGGGTRFIETVEERMNKQTRGLQNIMNSEL